MDMDALTSNLYSQYSAVYENTTKDSLNQALNIKTQEATDEELMEACKEFEQYFVEQMYKEMKKTVPEDSLLGDNEYMDMYEDTLISGIAEKVVDSGQLGYAQQLYETISKQSGSKHTI